MPLNVICSPIFEGIIKEPCFLCVSCTEFVLWFLHAVKNYHTFLNFCHLNLSSHLIHKASISFELFKHNYIFYCFAVSKVAQAAMLLTCI
jgi:hypothetical protein